LYGQCGEPGTCCQNPATWSRIQIGRSNRARVTKAIVALVLVVSTLLMLIVTVGGWSKLEGLVPVNIIWSVVYLTIAYYVLRWARGLLPIAAALGALMFVFTVIAGDVHWPASPGVTAAALAMRPCTRCSGPVG